MKEIVELIRPYLKNRVELDNLVFNENNKVSFEFSNGDKVIYSNEGWGWLKNSLSPNTIISFKWISYNIFYVCDSKYSDTNKLIDYSVCIVNYEEKPENFTNIIILDKLKFNIDIIL
jgi:hypothetical protein